MSILYTGIFFSAETQNKLKSLATEVFGSFYDKVQINRITLDFGDAPSDLVGKKVEFKVVGYFKDENAQVFKVDLDVPSKKNPHITVSHSKSVTPFYSNEVVEKGNFYAFDNPVTLPGTIGYFTTNGIVLDAQV